ncbi:MAG TPA: RNA polymerase sigma factor [Acidiferrobacterales bacterium]
MSGLEQQVVEHIPRLRRYARALLRGDALAADDLVQDCLERALGRMHRWRRGSDLRAWLFTIMHNLYVNQVRRAANGPRFVDWPEPDDASGAAADADIGLALRDLERALAALSPDQREIVLLVSLEGLRYQQVAAILGIPEGTVMSRLSRAREQLRAALTQGRPNTLWRVK